MLPLIHCRRVSVWRHPAPVRVFVRGGGRALLSVHPGRIPGADHLLARQHAHRRLGNQGGEYQCCDKSTSLQKRHVSLGLEMDST